MIRAQHTSSTPEHYTPAWLVDAIRDGFGGTIDLDPASCALGNEVVQASTVFSLQAGTNGLEQDWTPYQRVLVNPPGGLGGKLVKEFWIKAVDRALNNGTVVFIHFNLEQLATLDHPVSPGRFQIIVPRKRVAYDTEGNARDPRPFPTVAREALGKGASQAEVRAHAAKLRETCTNIVRAQPRSPTHHSAITIMSEDPDMIAGLTASICAACLEHQGAPAQVLVGVHIDSEPSNMVE